MSNKMMMISVSLVKMKSQPQEGVCVCMKADIFHVTFLLELSAFGLQCRKTIFYTTESIKKLVYTDYTNVLPLILNKLKMI